MGPSHPRQWKEEMGPGHSRRASVRSRQLGPGRRVSTEGEFAMLTGLYQAAEGMKVRLAAQDVISNNLANAGTAGFQREITMIRAERIPEPAFSGHHERTSDVPRRPPLEHLNPYSSGGRR